MVSLIHSFKEVCYVLGEVVVDWLVGRQARCCVGYISVNQQVMVSPCSLLAARSFCKSLVVSGILNAVLCAMWWLAMGG